MVSFCSYALAEFPTDEAGERATKMYHNVAFEDRTLVVLKAWFRPPKGKYIQWSLYFKTTHGTKKMWSYIAGGLKVKVL